MQVPPATTGLAVHAAARKVVKAEVPEGPVVGDDRYAQLVEDVQSCLTDDLRKPKYQGHENPMTGHCYVASEALYHTLGGKDAGWKPMFIRHEGEPHWFIQNEQGIILDPTASQFSTPVPYEDAKGMGFLTRQPSKRAQVLLERLSDFPGARWVTG